jgi:hypothetical protein
MECRGLRDCIKECFRINGLCQAGVHTGINGLLPDLVGGVGCQSDNGDLVTAGQNKPGFFRGFEAIRSQHVDVNQEDVEVLFCQLVECVIAGVRGGARVARPLRRIVVRTSWLRLLSSAMSTSPLWPRVDGCLPRALAVRRPAGSRKTVLFGTVRDPVI